MKISLSTDQEEAIDAAMSGSNLFLTGSAGVGKSFITQEIIKCLRKNKKKVAVTASTGIAAVNIGGVTVMNKFKIHPNMLTQKKDLKISKVWTQLDVLLIDEVSMISVDLFELLDLQAQLSIKNRLPFGGKQIILVGDFFQLPPVSDCSKLLFESKVWNIMNILTFELTTVHRQKDAIFTDLLERIRKGIFLQSDCDLLNQNTQAVLSTKREEEEEKKIEKTKLYALNKNVDATNLMALDSLPTDKKTYLTYSFFEEKARMMSADQKEKVINQYLKSTAIPQSFTIKVGAQVMLTQNISPKEGMANGSRGIVVKFSETTGFPIVKFEKLTVQIRPHKLPIYLSETSILNIVHIPLKLAWSLSIHKSQGQSISHLEVDLTNVFTDGQAYVALSRSTGLENLVVRGFSRKSVKVNPKVLAFYENNVF